jgi:hypothetical protein
MKANKLFSNKQYGFIEGRSTALQLLEVIDKWSEALDIKRLTYSCGGLNSKKLIMDAACTNHRGKQQEGKETNNQSVCKQVFIFRPLDNRLTAHYTYQT